MAKAPADQFYWGDWLNDVELQSACSSSRGIWINILCRMWYSKIRGEITGSLNQLIKLLNCTEDEFIIFLNEANKYQFCDINLNSPFVTFPLHVTHGNNFSNAIVTIKNRRMFKAEKERVNTRLRVQKYREKKGSNGRSNASVTIPSSSSSSIKEKKKSFYVTESKKVIDYLNEKVIHPFTYTKANIEMIKARLEEGHNLEECKRVIDVKWVDPDFKKKFFRPSTLFRPTKFEGYLNEEPPKRYT